MREMVIESLVDLIEELSDEYGMSTEEFCVAYLEFSEDEVNEYSRISDLSDLVLLVAYTKAIEMKIENRNM